MKIRILFTITTILSLAIGCSSKQEQTSDTGHRQSATETSDSTIYGLACDGCNDTIVVFLRLPYDGSDPDTLNILEASHQHQVFGTPLIGDKLAIIRNSQDTTKAKLIIVTEDLLGLWCYKVRPTLRQRADMEGQSINQTISQLPDSIRELLEEEREYGMMIKNDSVAYPYGIQWGPTTSDENSLIEYPVAKRYFIWYINNGRLILKEAIKDSLGNNAPNAIDTASIVMLQNDTLVLRFSDGERSYYHKDETDE